MAAMATVVMAAGVAGVSTAAASSVPGQPFYNVKRFGETAQLLFSFDPARRAELNLRFAERRMAEIDALSGEGRDVPVSLVEDWLVGQAEAWSEIRRLPEAQRDILTQVLLDMVSSGEIRQPQLRRLIANGAGLDVLLAQSDALAERVRAALATQPTAADTVPVEAPSGPMAVPRPLPQEELAGVPAPEAESDETVAAPPVNVQPQVPAAPPAEQPVAQPVASQPEPEPEDEEDPAASVPPAAGGGQEDPVAAASETPLPGMQAPGLVPETPEAP
jgi:hypothetical protein